jgi:hypothetical protein
LGLAVSSVGVGDRDRVVEFGGQRALRRDGDRVDGEDDHRVESDLLRDERGHDDLGARRQRPRLDDPDGLLGGVGVEGDGGGVHRVLS